MHLHYNFLMKKASISPIRVALGFSGEIESVLKKGESKSEFLHRGTAAIQETRQLGNGVAANEVSEKLKSKLLAARKAIFEFRRK